MESLEELATKLKGDMGEWEEGIFRWACGVAREKAEEILEKVDKEMMGSREEDLKAEGLRERCVTTLFGDIKDWAQALGLRGVSPAPGWRS